MDYPVHRRLVLFGAAGAAALVATRPALAAEAAEVVEGYLAAWNSHDPEKVAPFFDKEVEYYDASVGTPQKGRDNAMKNVVEAFFAAAPDSVWKQLGDPIVDKRAIAFEWEFSGTNTGDWADGTKATGKSFTFRGVSFIRLKGKHILYQGDYYDALGFYKQLGLM
jgi:predicted ester cyclase